MALPGAREEARSCGRCGAACVRRCCVRACCELSLTCAVFSRRPAARDGPPSSPRCQSRPSLRSALPAAPPCHPTLPPNPAAQPCRPALQLRPAASPCHPTLLQTSLHAVASHPAACFLPPCRPLPEVPLLPSPQARPSCTQTTLATSRRTSPLESRRSPQLSANGRRLGCTQVCAVHLMDVRCMRVCAYVCVCVCVCVRMCVYVCVRVCANAVRRAVGFILSSERPTSLTLLPPTHLQGCSLRHSPPCSSKLGADRYSPRCRCSACQSVPAWSRCSRPLHRAKPPLPVLWPGLSSAHIAV